MLKKLFVYLLLAGVATYVGILFGTPYYHYYGFKSDLEELATLRNLTDKEMREEVQESIDYFGVPIKLNSGSIQRGERRYFKLSFSWQETVNLLDLYEKTYSFSIDAKGSET